MHQTYSMCRNRGHTREQGRKEERIHMLPRNDSSNRWASPLVAGLRLPPGPSLSLAVAPSPPNLPLGSQSVLLTDIVLQAEDKKTARWLKLNKSPSAMWFESGMLLSPKHRWGSCSDQRIVCKEKDEQNVGPASQGLAI